MSPLMCCVGWARGDQKLREVGGVGVRANNGFGNVAGEQLPAVAQGEPVVSWG